MVINNEITKIQLEILTVQLFIMSSYLFKEKLTHITLVFAS